MELCSVCLNKRTDVVCLGCGIFICRECGAVNDDRCPVCGGFLR